MDATSQEALLDLLSVEDAGLEGHLGWYRDEAGTLRYVYISEGEFLASQKSFREDPDSSVTIAR